MPPVSNSSNNPLALARTHGDLLKNLADYADRIASNPIQQTSTGLNTTEAQQAASYLRALQNGTGEGLYAPSNGADGTISRLLRSYQRQSGADILAASNPLGIKIAGTGFFMGINALEAGLVALVSPDAKENTAIIASSMADFNHLVEAGAPNVSLDLLDMRQNLANILNNPTTIAALREARTGLEKLEKLNADGLKIRAFLEIFVEALVISQSSAFDGAAHHSIGDFRTTTSGANETRQERVAKIEQLVDGLIAAIESGEILTHSAQDLREVAKLLTNLNISRPGSVAPATIEALTQLADTADLQTMAEAKISFKKGAVVYEFETPNGHSVMLVSNGDNQLGIFQDTSSPYQVVVNGAEAQLRPHQGGSYSSGFAPFTEGTPLQLTLKSSDNSPQFSITLPNPIPGSSVERTSSQSSISDREIEQVALNEHIVFRTAITAWQQATEANKQNAEEALVAVINKMFNGRSYRLELPQGPVSINDEQRLRSQLERILEDANYPDDHIDALAESITELYLKRHGPAARPALQAGGRPSLEAETHPGPKRRLRRGK